MAAGGPPHTRYEATSWKTSCQLIWLWNTMEWQLYCVSHMQGFSSGAPRSDMIQHPPLALSLGRIVAAPRPHSRVEASVLPTPMSLPLPSPKSQRWCSLPFDDNRIVSETRPSPLLGVRLLLPKVHLVGLPTHYKDVRERARAEVWLKTACRSRARVLWGHHRRLHRGDWHGKSIKWLAPSIVSSGKILSPAPWRVEALVLPSCPCRPSRAQHWCPLFDNQDIA